MGSRRASEEYSACPLRGYGAGGEDVEGRAAVLGDACCCNDERSIETVASRVIAERAALGGRMTRRGGNDATVAQLNPHHLER